MSEGWGGEQGWGKEEEGKVGAMKPSIFREEKMSGPRASSKVLPMEGLTKEEHSVVNSFAGGSSKHSPSSVELQGGKRKTLVISIEEEPPEIINPATSVAAPHESRSLQRRKSIKQMKENEQKSIQKVTDRESLCAVVKRIFRSHVLSLWKDHLNSNATLRRLYRLSLLLLLSSCIFLIPHLMMESSIHAWNLEPKKLLFYSAHAIKIELIGSSLLLKDGGSSSAPVGIMALEALSRVPADAPSSDPSVHSSNSRCSVRYGATEDEAVVENCIVKLQYPSKGPFPTLDLSFKRGANKEFSPTLSGSGLQCRSLKVTGDFVDVSIDGIHIENSLSAYIENGDIGLTHLNSSDTANFGIHSKTGNVMAIMSRSFDLHFQQPEATFCFGAKLLEKVGGACFDNRCTSGFVKLLQENVTLNEMSHIGGMPHVNITSSTGSIYAVADSAGGHQQSSASADKIPGMNFTAGHGMASGKLKLSKSTQRHLVLIAEESVKRPDAGIYITFDPGKTVGSSQDQAKLIYSSRSEAFILEPWIFDVMSLGVVAPRAYSVPLRWTIPLACPVIAGAAGVPHGVDFRDLKQMTSTIKHEMLSYMEVYNNVSGNIRPPAVVGHKSASLQIPMFGLASQTHMIHSVSVTDGAPVFMAVHASSSPGVVWTVVLSLCISVGVAVGLTGIAATHLGKFIRHFQLSHSKLIAMKRLQNVIQSAAYSDPRFKEQFAREMEKEKIEAAIGSATKDQDKGEEECEESDDDDDRDSDEDDSGDDDMEEDLSVGYSFPFAIPEMISESWTRGHTKSLRPFLLRRTKTLLQPVGQLSRTLGGSRPELITLKRFQSLYHGYCFRNRLRPESLRKATKVLASFGVIIKSIFDHRTDAFLGIRFCVEKERRERLEVKPFPRESALSFFVRKRCVLSPFQSDFITFREFARRYENFTKLPIAVTTRPVPVTKREMLRLGVSWKRLQLRYIEARPFQYMPTDAYLSQVSLKQNKGRIEESSSKIPSIDDIGGDDRIVPIWFFPDFFVVLSHVFLITLLVFPLAAIPFFAEAAAEKSSAVPKSAIDEHYYIRSDDIYEWGRPMYMKLRALRMRNLSATSFLIGVIGYCLCIVELVLYYANEPFNVSQQAQQSPHWARRGLHKVIQYSLLLFFGSWVAYFTLVLTIWILGAVLEPTYYLPYATAAGGFILFSSAKASALFASFKSAHKAITNAVRLHFAQKSQENIKVLRSCGSDMSGGIGSANVNETKALRLVDSDIALSAILARCSAIDLLMALGLANGDQQSVNIVSVEFGMNREILAAIIAVARRDHSKIMSALSKMGSKNTVGAKSELLRVLYRLAEKQNESSLRLAIKEAIIYSESINKANAHELEAIVAIGRGNISRIVDVLWEVQAECIEHKGPENIKLTVLCALLELVRSNGFRFQKQIFGRNWTNLCTSVSKLPEQIAQGLSQLYQGQLRRKQAIETLELLDGCDEVIARLVMAVASGSSDEIRLYGPGSKAFQRILHKYFGIDLPLRELSAFMAIAHSSLVEVEKLARYNGLYDNVAVAVSHGMAESEGLGNTGIGLVTEENAVHLEWLASNFNLDPPVFLGIMCIVNQNASDSHMSHTYVEAAIQWFVSKNPSDMEAMEIKDIICSFCHLWASKDLNEVLQKAQNLLRMAGGPKLEQYAEIVLLARGFIPPRAFFEDYGEKFGLHTNGLKKLKAQKFHFVNSFGQPEDFTQHTWFEFHAHRVNTMKKISKYVCEALLKKKTLKKYKLKAVRGLMLMEAKFPISFEEMLSAKGMSSEIIRNLSSFAMMSVEHIVNPPVRTKIVNTLSRLLGVHPDAFEYGILNVCHERSSEWKESSLCHPNSLASIQERLNSSPCLRRGAAYVEMAEALDLGKDFVFKLQNFVSDFDLMQQRCRNIKQSVSWLSDQLRQPRFLCYIICRSHEPSFGIGGAGELDRDYHFHVNEFLAQMKVKSPVLLECIQGLCHKLPKQLGCFGQFLNASEDNIILACQLFGNVELYKMVNNLDKFLDCVKEAAGSHWKSNSLDKVHQSSSLRVRWYQPNPVGRLFQAWNVVLACLGIFYSLIVPFELVGIIYRQGAWVGFDAICDIIFLVDIGITFVTPYFDRRQKRFVLEPKTVAIQYFKGWFLTDFITSIPTTLIGLAVSSKPVWFQYVRILKILRVIRAARVGKSVSRRRRDARIRKKIGQKGYTSIDLIRAFTKMAGESNEPLSSSTILPSDVLSSVADGLPKAMLSGLMDVHKGRQQAVKKKIVRMTAEGSLSIDESIARGLMSLATGEVDGIEDVAEALGFDPDVAEGLAFICSSVTTDVKHSQLSASSSLHHLTNKLGLDMETVSAVLALVNQDYEAGQEINNDLSLIDIDGKYFSAILATFFGDTPEEPAKKTDIVIQHIGPLRRLYAPSLENDSMGCLIRLVQGDATVIRGVLGDFFSFSRQERNTLCALALIAQHSPLGRKSFEQPKHLDFSPKESFDWDQTRNAQVCCRVISRVMGVNRRAVFRVIAGCHGHPKSLNRLSIILGLKLTEVKTTQIRLQSIAGWTEDDDSDDDDGDDETGSASSSNASSVPSAASSASSTESRMDGSDGLLAAMKCKRDVRRITDALNAKYPAKPGSGGKVKRLLTDADVDWLIHLAYGDIKCRDWTYLLDFVRKMRLREYDNKGNPAVQFRTLQHILAIAVGQCDNWNVEESDTESRWWDIEGDVDTGSIPEDETWNMMDNGILLDLGFKPSQLPLGIQFITMFGSGNHKCWDLANRNGSPSSRIYPDTRIVKGLGALASSDLDTIDKTLPAICTTLGTDLDAIRSILCLALGDMSRLSQEVAKIIRRTGGKVTLQIAIGFCAGASSDLKEVKDMLSPMCNQLNVNSELASAIVVSTQCNRKVSVRAWRQLCTTAIQLADEDGVITDEERELPRFWLVDAIAATLKQDKAEITKYTQALDRLLGFGGLWEAAFESGNVVGWKEPPENYVSLSGALYAIATNDMRFLPHFLRVLGMKDNQAVTNITILVSVFNRQYSNPELKALESTLQSNTTDLTTKFPPGMLTAIASSMVGDLDNFAYAMNQVAEYSAKNGLAFIHTPGLPELLVSLKRGDEHGDINIFKAALHSCSHKAKNGISHSTKSAGQKKRHSTARTATLTSKWRNDSSKAKSLNSVAGLDAPQTYICPLSGTLMTDPVNAEDGYTYDRESILSWLVDHNESPTTKLPMGTTLVTDLSLKSDIASFTESSETSSDQLKMCSSIGWTEGMKHLESMDADIETKLVKFIYAVLTSDTKLMLKTVDVFNFDNHLAVGLATLVERTTEIPLVYKGNQFGELVKCLQNHIPDVPGEETISPQIFARLLCILSKGFGSLGVINEEEEKTFNMGRSVGISTDVYALANEYLEERGLKVLDTVFLAQRDPSEHTEAIVDCVPELLDLVNQLDTQVEKLLKGILFLTSPMDSKEAEIEARALAINELSQCYKTKPDVVALCIGLARSNMTLVQRVSRQVGEFDLAIMSDIFKLVKRLTPICRSADSELDSIPSVNDEEEEDNPTVLVAAEKEETSFGPDQLLQPQHIFSQCVRGGDSYMTFDEFKVAMKILGLISHDQRMKQLFLMGDEFGRGVLTMDSFTRLMQRITNTLATDIKFRIGRTGLQYLQRFSAAVLLLLALFLFILVGIEAFSISGGFAAATSGSLFAIIGTFLQNYTNEALNEDGGSDAKEDDSTGSGTVDVESPQEVAEILDNILSIHAID